MDRVAGAASHTFGCTASTRVVTLNSVSWDFEKSLKFIRFRPRQCADFGFKILAPRYRPPFADWWATLIAIRLCPSAWQTNFWRGLRVARERVEPGDRNGRKKISKLSSNFTRQDGGGSEPTEFSTLEGWNRPLKFDSSKIGYHLLTIV